MQKEWGWERGEEWGRRRDVWRCEEWKLNGDKRNGTEESGVRQDCVVRRSNYITRLGDVFLSSVDVLHTNTEEVFDAVTDVDVHTFDPLDNSCTIHFRATKRDFSLLCLFRVILCLLLLMHLLC